MKKSISLLLILVLLVSLTRETTNAQEAESFSFAFLTDIHLQPEKHATEGFIQAIHTVNALNPDFVLTGGDLIMDALGESQERSDSVYELYVKTSLLFNMPVYNTPGNHEHFAFYMEDEITPDHPDYGDGMYKRYLGIY